MMAVDYVASAFWTWLLGGVVVIVAGGVVTFVNRESETMVLGFTALAGAFVLFGLQLFFHLRGSTVETPVGTQIVINKTAPAANALEPGNMMRAVAERDAARWLASTSPDAFKDAGKLVRHLLVFSILNYFTSDEVDWRMKRSSYDFPAMGAGASTTFFELQPPQAAYSLSLEDIRSTLRAGKNLFTEAPLHLVSFVGLRLPPGSRLTVVDATPPTMQTTLTIFNPITRIDFIITPASLTEGIRPPAPGQQGLAFGQSVLAGWPDAEYSLYFMKVLIQTTFAATRAHHPDVDQHRAWVDRIERGLGNWFRSENRPRPE